MNMKKHMLVLIAIAAIMLAVGCVSSGSENAASKNTASPSADSSQAASADDQWLQHVTKYSPMLTADINDFSSASNSSDYTLMATDGQKIVDDTQVALDENSKITVSSKYQEAQKEWTAGLQDCNSAGKYIVLAANDAKAGNDSTENSQKAASLMISGGNHLNKASDLI
jgi:outer membrane biogenesis lipoprotein LolB